jgi:hypothetical protein
VYIAPKPSTTALAVFNVVYMLAGLVLGGHAGRG